MTLLPGDVICSGTSAGVGMGMKPPAYIREGDVILPINYHTGKGG